MMMEREFRYNIGDTVYGVVQNYEYCDHDEGVIVERDENPGGNVPKYRVKWFKVKFLFWAFETDLHPDTDYVHYMAGSPNKPRLTHDNRNMSDKFWHKYDNQFESTE